MVSRRAERERERERESRQRRRGVSRSLRAAAALVATLYGLAEPGDAQAPGCGLGPLVFLGNVNPPAAWTIQPVSIQGGTNKTGVVGERPAVSGVWTAFISNEQQANLDLNASGTIGPNEHSVRLLNLDNGEHLFVNPVDPVPEGGVALVAPNQGTAAGVLMCCITREANPFPGDINGDGDFIDYFATFQRVLNAYPNYNILTYGLGAPPAFGVVTGFRRVQMSGTMMVLEQGDPTAAAPAVPLLMAVLDIGGLAGTDLINTTPNPWPHFNYTLAGFNPSISHSTSTSFPQSQMLVYEQSEAQLGDSNGDGDQCDRILTRSALGISPTTPAGCYPPAPLIECVCPSISPPCLLGVGNRPSVRPHPTFGNLVGFDGLEPTLQAGAGPNCAPVPLVNPNSASGGRADAGGCLIVDPPGTKHAEQVSVSGRIYAFVIRELASNVNSDEDGNGMIEAYSVFWTHQSTFMNPRSVIGPGLSPASEQFFDFPTQGIPSGAFRTLVVFTGDENLLSTPDLNGDGDQSDLVIQFYLQ